MVMSINTNISAMTAQRYLGINNMNMSSSLAKLSSGSRVPQAKDDAAALAIGSQLRAEVGSLKQASQNATQAVSMLQIADGSLSTIGDILTRMKSLATQAASGQLSNSERDLLNQEFTNLQSEVDRIANNTEFNGTTLINGGGTGAVTQSEHQLGYLQSNGISVEVDTGVATSGDAFEITYAFDDQGGAYNASTASTYTSDTYKMTVTNLNSGASETVDITSRLADKIGDNNPATNMSTGETLDVGFASLGITVTLNENFDRDGTALTKDTTAIEAGDDAAVTLGASTVEFASGSITKAILDRMAGLSNFDATTGQMTLTFQKDGANAVDLAAVSGLQYQVNGGTLTADNTETADLASTVDQIISVYDATDDVKLFDLTLADAAATAGAGTETETMVIDFNQAMFGESFSTAASTTSFTYKVGSGTGANDDITVALNSTTGSDLGISSDSIGTAANAETAMSNLDTAITTLSNTRANIGAAQSRLEFASASIEIAIENTSAAESALMDVDVSSEMTNFTSKQVLLQAGISMLAQANQQPSLLLRLLQ